MLAGLQDVPLFAGLDMREKESLISGGRSRRLGRGEPLFSQGDVLTHFYLLVSGTMQLVRAAASGREKTIALLKSGQVLCEDEIMDACHHQRTSAVALEDCVLLEFQASWLKEAARKHTAFALNLLSLIAHRAHMAELEAEHQASMSAAQLVACFMQRLCVLHDFDPKSFELPYSKLLIASRLGMEPETFSRTLAKLDDHGIHIEGNKVRITDLEKVGSYVCSACSIAGECATHIALERKLGK